ncbi:MAG TPA: GNAT family N-acetyltransferase [Allosphingosinicella sp.]
MSRKYVPFLKGELIDLCVPSKAALDDGWADWFNDAETTHFLDQGVFPNTREQQEEFYRALPGGSRVSLLVCDKTGNQLWGTISLSSLNWVARSAQIAMVLPRNDGRPALAALEAMARLSEHGFSLMGLERIWAGQSYPGLAKWNQRLELLGYFTEGVLRGAVAKGRRVSDSVAISVLYADYAAIVARRDYWPGEATMQRLVKALPESPLAERLSRAIAEEQSRARRELLEAEQRVLGEPL